MFNNISGEKLISRSFEIACLGLLVRSIAVGADLGGAIAIVSIVSSICYKQWLAKAVITEKETLEAKIDELSKKFDSEKQSLEARIDSAFHTNELHITEVSNKIQAVSLGQGIKRSITNEQIQQTEPTGISKRFF